ncbi:MAG: MBL fold metallo-hydrolase [Acidobacteriota bacterium]
MRRRDFLAATGASALGAVGPFSVRSEMSRSASPIIVKVLGTAQDGGIPHLGCTCPNCSRARRDPKERRLIVSLAVADFSQKKIFLIDATPDIRVQAEAAVRLLGPGEPKLLEALEGVALTHAHIGHYTGLMFFGYESVSAKKLPVFASRRMADFLTNNGPWSQLVRLENIALQLLALEEQLALTGSIRITAFAVPHRDEYTDTLGMRIAGPEKTLLYIPDIQSWGAWDRSLAAEVEKTDFSLLDGTFYAPEELPGRDATAIGHPPIRETVRLLRGLPSSKKAGVFFTHLNHTNLALDPAGAARREMEDTGFHLASDGLEFVL